MTAGPPPDPPADADGTDASRSSSNGATPNPAASSLSNGATAYPACVLAASNDAAPGGGEPRELGRHPVTTYASIAGAERYRRIMRVFFLNKTRDLDWRLTPEQVAAKLRDAFGLVLDTTALEGALDQLYDWGALSRENDSSDAPNAREFRRKRFSYDITTAAERIEKLLADLDGLVEEVGALESSRLPGIRDALLRIAQALRTEQPDATLLRDELEYLVNSIGSLREGATNFMSNVGGIVSTSEAIDEQDFTSYKSSLIEHLEGFHRALRVHSEEIIQALDQINDDATRRLVDLVAGVDATPSLLGISAEETTARRRAEIAGRWHAVRSWFLADSHQQQTWNALNNKVLEAIQAVLDIAERLIERSANRADRATAWEYLAAICHASDEPDAAGWFAAALGVQYPRHFNTPERDIDELAHPAQTTWAQAPPAPVATHLRTPGSRRPGAGRGAALRSNDAAADAARRRRAVERQEIAALTARFAGRGPIRLADVGRLSSIEFSHVVDWIGRAFESPADSHGRRTASSMDLQLQIILHPPADPEQRTVLHTTYGRLSTPDYTLEVQAG
jgi:uncharacterized protein (TIGR02677 family)